MPQYKYQCEKCGELCLTHRTDQVLSECPLCNCRKFKKKFSANFFTSSNKVDHTIEKQELKPGDHIKQLIEDNIKTKERLIREMKNDVEEL